MPPATESVGLNFLVLVILRWFNLEAKFGAFVVKGAVARTRPAEGIGSIKQLRKQLGTKTSLGCYPRPTAARADSRGGWISKQIDRKAPGGCGTG